MKRFLWLIVVLVACSSPPAPTETPQATQDAPQSELVAQVDECGGLFRLERQGANMVYICVEEGTAVPPTETGIPPTPTLVIPTETATPPAPVNPFVGAVKCPLEFHDDKTWHELWDYDGCWVGHHHGDDPHLMDDLFGTQVYGWVGGDFGSPWQTFTGAHAHYEQPGPEACLENDCKHNFYRWYIVENFPCGPAPGARNCVINARIMAHVDPAQIGARVRFHSLFLEVEVCTLDGLNCGQYHGGGHWDSGKLDVPRTVYHPLDGDPPEWRNMPAPNQPYRIGCDPAESVPCLESWQSEGSAWQAPQGDIRILTGFGVHLGDPWSPIDVSSTVPPMSAQGIAETQFYCDGEIIEGVFYPEPGCRFNGSEATVFRVWLTIPAELDNGPYDTDQRVGFFSFSGYTDRYGKIVEGCTAPGLDCVPALAEGVPVGQAGMRGGVGMGYDREYDVCARGDVVVPCSEEGALSLGWIIYP